MEHVDEMSWYVRWLPLVVVLTWAAGLIAFLSGLYLYNWDIPGFSFVIGAGGLFVGFYSLRNYIWGKFRFSPSRAAIVILFAIYGFSLLSYGMGLISERTDTLLVVLIGFGFLFIRWKYSYETMTND